MKDDRKRDEFYEQFLKTNVEIILTNQMHYNGKVLGYGNIYLKILDRKNKIVFILLDKISTITIDGGWE